MMDNLTEDYSTCRLSIIIRYLSEQGWIPVQILHAVIFCCQRWVSVEGHSSTWSGLWCIDQEVIMGFVLLCCT